MQPHILSYDCVSNAITGCEGPLTEAGASFVCRSNPPRYDDCSEMLVGAPLFATYNLRGSPVGASNERLIGAEKVFTRLLKIGLGDFASLLELDNDTAAFIAPLPVSKMRVGVAIIDANDILEVIGPSMVSKMSDSDTWNVPVIEERMFWMPMIGAFMDWHSISFIVPKMETLLKVTCFER